eukprot:1067634-Rhodomonas_salina.2
MKRCGWRGHQVQNAKEREKKTGFEDLQGWNCVSHWFDWRADQLEDCQGPWQKSQEAPGCLGQARQGD